jgi:hypothetical protein
MILPTIMAISREIFRAVPDTQREGMLALGAPCKVKGPLAGTPAQRWVEINPAAYQALAQRHRLGVEPV